MAFFLESIEYENRFLLILQVGDSDTFMRKIFMNAKKSEIIFDFSERIFLILF